MSLKSLFSAYIICICAGLKLERYFQITIRYSPVEFALSCKKHTFQNPSVTRTEIISHLTSDSLTSTVIFLSFVFLLFRILLILLYLLAWQNEFTDPTSRFSQLSLKEVWTDLRHTNFDASRKPCQCQIDWRYQNNTH